MATNPNFANLLKNTKKAADQKIKGRKLKKLQDENENLHRTAFVTLEKKQKVKKNRAICNLETEKIMGKFNVKLYALESEFDDEVIELQEKHLKIENNILRPTITILKK